MPATWPHIAATFYTVYECVVYLVYLCITVTCEHHHGYTSQRKHLQGAPGHPRDRVFLRPTVFGWSLATGKLARHQIQINHVFHPSYLQVIKHAVKRRTRWNETCMPHATCCYGKAFVVFICLYRAQAVPITTDVQIRFNKEIVMWFIFIIANMQF